MNLYFRSAYRNIFEFTGASGSSGIIDDVMGGDQILFTVHDHPVDVFFIVFVGTERNFFAIIFNGPDIAKIILSAISGILILLYDLQQ